MTRYTDEDIINLANAYMQRFPNASRTKIITNIPGGQERIYRLEKEGRINLPKPIPKSVRTQTWRTMNHKNVKERHA